MLLSAPGDINGDGQVDAVDISMQIDIVYFGAPIPQDPGCPASRSDFNNDGYPNTIDTQMMIGMVYFGGDGPVDPCAP